LGIKDRFDLTITAASREAVDHYIVALDLLLSANTGAEERFARAIDIDPEFALAHIAYARLLQLQARMPEARRAALGPERWAAVSRSANDSMSRRSLSRSKVPRPRRWR